MNEPLTNMEYEIVSLMWEEGRPLSKSEIIELSVDKSWKPSSIHILLNSLLKKEAIGIDGFVRTGKNYGRTFVPTISQEEYIARLVGRKKEHKPVNIALLFSALSESVAIDDDTIQELEKIIEKLKEEHRQ